MIGILIQFVILVLVLGVIYYVLKLIAGALELPGVVVQVAGIVIVLIVAIWLLSLVGGMAGGRPRHEGLVALSMKGERSMTSDDEIRDLRMRVTRLEALLTARHAPTPPLRATLRGAVKKKPVKRAR